MTSETHKVELLVRDMRRRLWPLLSGQPPEVQGAALADLLATWLAGHVVEGDAAATSTLREEMLAEHMHIVRQLIPINSRAIHGRE
jgi:hypothetical protein